MPHQRSRPIEEYSIKSLRLALGVFDAFAGDREEVSFGELCRIVRKSDDVVALLAKDLVARGYLEEGGQPNVYRLGLQWFLLRDLYLEANTLRKVAVEEMTALMHAIHQSVYLARFDRGSGKAVYIETVDAPESVVLVSRIGSNAPPHCTAAGKSMLAFLPEAKREELLKSASFEAYTGKTITDRASFVAHLAEVRESGIAMDDEEYLEGVRCIAAPVFNCLGEAVASVGIAGYHTGAEINRTELEAHLRDTARAISSRLGYRWEEEAKVRGGAGSQETHGGG